MADDRFLSRWARLKAEASREPIEPDRPADPAALPAAGDDGNTTAVEKFSERPPDDETRERWIEELRKIDMDRLTYADDFRIFLRAWVPQALRRKALRKLWTTDPLLACLDGLNDYEEDFTDAGTVVAGLKSSWRPGSGFGWMDEEKDEAGSEPEAEEQEEESIGDGEEMAEDLAPDAGETGEPVIRPQAVAAPGGAAPAGASEDPSSDTPRPTVPRRMVWRTFDEP